MNEKVLSQWENQNSTEDNYSDLEYKSDEGQTWDPAMDEDIIQTFLESKVEALVKEYLATNSEAIIDLAIKAYILNRKNQKIEKQSWTVQKKSVKK